MKDRSHTQYTSQLVNISAIKIVLYDELKGLHERTKNSQMGNAENF